MKFLEDDVYIHCKATLADQKMLNAGSSRGSRWITELINAFGKSQLRLLVDGEPVI